MIPRSFCNRNTLSVARDVLGCYLITRMPEGETVGRIVETEAYLSNDPACHASRGETLRNAPMFGEPGTVYVYFIYGMYHCFNIVTRRKGIGEAVLIRALEPISGIAIMKRRRNTNTVLNLCSGPAKLVQAMGIGREHNNTLLNEHIFLERGTRNRCQIEVTGRIGIKKGAHLPYRFLLKGNAYISKGVQQRLKGRTSRG